jgi:hypothetical protein
MNLWRCLGTFLFLMGILCLLANPRAGVYGQDKKDKDQQEKKDQKTEKEKKEVKESKESKETKVTETKTGGAVMKFTAFDPDKKPFYQELTTKTEQNMKVMGQDIQQKQEQTFVIEWTPDKKDGDNYVVHQRIVGVKMKIDIGGNKISYDSTDKNPKNPMTDFFEQLTKQKLTFVIDPKLEVKEVKGRKEFIDALGETNPQMKTLLNTILSQEALTKMAEPTWWALPSQGVTEGKTWNKDSDLKLGPIGSYHTTFHFKYEGKDKGLDKIGITADLTYTAPGEKEGGGLPFTIKEAKLSSKEAKGEALFSEAKGRFESSKMDMKLGGTLTIQVGNMNTEITLEQKQDSVSKTSDSNPWAGSGAKEKGQ